MCSQQILEDNQQLSQLADEYQTEQNQYQMDIQSLMKSNNEYERLYKETCMK
jgi:hypothetical protein